MLRVSKLADYGTVVMNLLALQSGQHCSAKAIAEKAHLALPTVSKVLKLLTVAKLVESERGAGGGYRLAKAANKITLADVISAIEGRALGLTECADNNDSCAQHAVCLVRENWQLVNQVIVAALRSLTLADMTSSIQHHPLVTDGIKWRKVIPLNPCHTTAEDA